MERRLRQIWVDLLHSIKSSIVNKYLFFEGENNYEVNIDYLEPQQPEMNSSYQTAALVALSGLSLIGAAYLAARRLFSKAKLAIKEELKTPN